VIASIDVGERTERAGLPRAVVTAPDGHEHVLHGGDLIGRAPSAAMFVDDPRVSEAHAIVSLRRGALQLLALRRLFAVGGRTLGEVKLAPGLTIDLADGVAMAVRAVDAPVDVLAIVAPGRLPRPLPPVASIVGGPPPRVVPRFEPDAPLHVWGAGGEWRVREGGGATRPLAPGDELVVGGARFAITAIPVVDAGPLATEPGRGGFDPVRVVAYYDRVELHRRQHEVLTIGGIGAQIISELVACAGPLAWDVLARQLWPDHGGDVDLRHRWDVALHRLRARLRDAGVRADLLHSDRSGQIGLVLLPGDDVDDRT
jgi:hypothetical protein